MPPRSNMNTCLYGKNKCLFCSKDSANKKHKKANRKAPKIDYPNFGVGLVCSECQGHACMSCMFRVIHGVSPDTAADDRWCCEVLDYLNNGTVPESFIGHCCELKQERLVAEPEESQECRFDGHLHFPEFSLVVDSPLTCVDVHGLGATPDLPPVWHSVVSHEAARRYHRENVNPNGSAALMDDIGQIFVMTLSLPYYQDNQKFTVRVRTAYQTSMFSEEHAGENDPLSEEIRRCKVISVNDETRQEGVNIDIITGRFADCPDKETLLLFRM